MKNSDKSNIISKITSGILADFMNEKSMLVHKKLIGHSGCTLQVLDNAGRLFVRKISKSSDYNQRLILQCKKQKHNQFIYFKKPEVYGEGYLDGLYYFDMEYINGVTMAEYISSASLVEISEFADMFIKELSPLEDHTEDVSGLFKEKISSLKKTFGLMGIESPANAVVLEAFTLLEAFPWGINRLSRCHGDMTLENIIVSKHGLYLIDHLDSFFESWLIDLSKLLQDLEVYWSYRHGQIDQNIKIRCYILKNKILESIRSTAGLDAVIFAYHALLVNLIRILPYTKDEATRDLIINGIRKVLGIIKKGEFK